MKSLGFKLLPIARINEPVDLQARRGQQNVLQLADSIRAGVLLHPLVVRKRGDNYDVVAGRDRFAALCDVGVKIVGCHVVDGTAEEMLAATEAENLYRRPPAGRAAAIVERLQQVETSQPGTLSQVTRTANARKQVAREAGVKPATVRKAEQRQRAKDSGNEGPSSFQPDAQNAMAGKGVNPATFPLPAGSPIDMHGLPAPPIAAFLDDVQAIHVALERANSLLQQAQAALAPLQRNPAWEVARYARLKEAIHRLAFECRAWRPASVCLYCRMGVGQTKCNGCRGMGWLSVEAMEIVPKALLDGGAPVPTAARERKLDIQLVDADPAPPDLTLEPLEDTGGEPF